MPAGQILADTSIWIDHFRRGDAMLSTLLQNEAIAIHPYVIGELACGSLTQRVFTLDLLAALPQTLPASHNEALLLLDVHGLFSRGLGWIDIHLLASAMLSHTRLWTRDARLAAAAEQLGIDAGL
jgi:predicted nucleic acid-binding protein